MQERSYQDSVKNFISNFLLGGVSFATSNTLTFPLQFVKLEITMQHRNPKIASGELPRYQGFFDVLKRVTLEQGPFAIWKGNLNSISRFYYNFALRVSFKDFYQQLFQARIDPKEKPYTFFGRNLLSAGLAGLSNLFLTYPFDRIRMELSNDYKKEKYIDFKDCSIKLIKSKGIKAFYKEISYSILPVFVYSSFYFGLFDTAIGLGYNQYKFLTAFCGVILSQYIVNPFEVVRRRMAMQSGSQYRVYNGMVDCFQKIYREEGVKQFFKYSLHRSIHKSTMLAMYGQLQEYLMDVQH